MLASETDARWLPLALSDMDRVLTDHAHCERKAAASAMSLVAGWPQDHELIRRLSALAIEEIQHFRAVVAQLSARGRVLGRDPGDPYAQRLGRLVRHGPRERLVDRLLVAALIEARSCERLGLLATGLADADPALARFYAKLAGAESGHARLFVDLARAREVPERVDARMERLATAEAEILAALPIEPRIH